MTTEEGLRRTHWCGQVDEKDLERKITVQGWISRIRDHGGVFFVDLRDRRGLLQVVFNPAASVIPEEEINRLRIEYVISVEGEVHRRPEGMENENIRTGKVELRASRLQIVNTAEPPVFPISDDAPVDEALRLKYRYLDLRRPIMQERMAQRHKCIRFIRDYLDSREFIEVETPMLTKSTPEGARDYLVPSRVNPGCFFALPQSPQLFKQMLMVSGLDRYYQIARCFRDEDLRADRQPEFTQLDLEMSFVSEEDVMGLMEDLMADLFHAVRGIDSPRPFPVLTYRESMDRFGADNPDTRFGLELFDLTETALSSGFQVFRQTAEKGGVVKGLAYPGGAGLTRRELDELTGLMTEWGGQGLAWMKFKEGWTGPIAKFFSSGELDRIGALSGAEDGACVFFVADEWETASTLLGRLRLHLAKNKGMIPEGEFRFIWVTGFPLVTFDEDEKRYVAVHHPFTAPLEEDLPLLESDIGKVRARAYDLVLNGQEIGGGSIRIHKPELQMKMFDLLGISKEEADKKFGFLLESFRYGVPPHGGIAMGLDRIVAILAQTESIREVIAFPKTQRATCLLTGAPNEVTPEQLRELHIRSVAKTRRKDG